jgi:predicted tellurium resistance membrane protein TerC
MDLFGWIGDPTAWVGLGTLVVLEIVLGVDNLIFIAILTDKLPPELRNRARLVGLSLALFMRLGLLAGISWIATLTAPLFSVGGLEVSGRDLILIAGGLFLLFKSTTELHERLEGSRGGQAAGTAPAAFWQAIVQIVVLDAVFSLDSVITAVGMVDELTVMMIAVVIAVGVMMLASRPLTEFVTRHPTVVILCLGFLLMIGLSLVVEGFGAHIPKGYLYAAIGFSVLIEAFNQVALRNRRRAAARGDLRGRAAETVLRLLGGARPNAEAGDAPVEEVVAALPATTPDGEPVFAAEERTMIKGVLGLADRPVRSIMTPSTEVVWLDLDGDAEELRRKILQSAYPAYPVCRGGPERLAGVATAPELVRDLLEKGRIDLESLDRTPLVVDGSMSVLDVVERIRSARIPMAIVADESGTVEGLFTPTDILDAIIGETGDDGEEKPAENERKDGASSRKPEAEGAQASA